MWFQNRRMKHKRQTLSKTDEEDDNKGDEDSQPCSKCDCILFMLFCVCCGLRVPPNMNVSVKNADRTKFNISFSDWKHNHLEDALSPDSSSKKSCQGCELPSDDIPDSTSNSRGHNNNTPSATNNNNKNLGNGICNLLTFPVVRESKTNFIEFTQWHRIRP